jgi:hypothetical protein
MIDSFLSMGFGMIADRKRMTEELKERALKEYEAALKMPRKKKKKAKKSALILYSMACWAEI